MSLEDLYTPIQGTLIRIGEEFNKKTGFTEKTYEGLSDLSDEELEHAIFKRVGEEQELRNAYKAALLGQALYDNDTVRIIIDKNGKTLHQVVGGKTIIA